MPRSHTGCLGEYWLNTALYNGNGMYCVDPKDWTVSLDTQDQARGGSRVVFVEYTFELQDGYSDYFDPDHAFLFPEDANKGRYPIDEYRFEFAYPAHTINWESKNDYVSEKLVRSKTDVFKKD